MSKGTTIIRILTIVFVSKKAQRHLPFLGLFVGKFHRKRLGSFAGGVEHHDDGSYQAVFGERLSGADWKELLEEASAAGLLNLFTDGWYRIHPVLPWILRRRLVEQISGPDGIGEASRTQVINNLDYQGMKFYAGVARKSFNMLVGSAERAMGILRMEEPNLLQQLRSAERQSPWNLAQALSQPIHEMYERTGRKAESRALQQRGIYCVGRDIATAKARGIDALELWMRLRVTEADDLTDSKLFEQARKIVFEILEELGQAEDDQFHHDVRVA